MTDKDQNGKLCPELPKQLVLCQNSSPYGKTRTLPSALKPE